MSAVDALLSRLEVQPGGLVYLHTSFSRLRHLAEHPRALLEAVLRHLGPDGTLVLPSFAWHLDPSQRPWKGMRTTTVSRPLFDVRHTASNIGSVPECFRTWTGVRRSADYWWSVAAVGPLASVLTEGQHLISHPFGPGSTFHRLWQSGAHVVGLGVSLNTTSLAPVVDHVLGARHPQQVFSPSMEEGHVIDEHGREIVTRTLLAAPRGRADDQTVRGHSPAPTRLAVAFGARMKATRFISCTRSRIIWNTHSVLPPIPCSAARGCHGWSS